MIDACVWLLCVPGFFSLQLYNSPGSICSCDNRSLSVHRFKDVVFKDFRENVSTDFVVLVKRYVHSNGISDIVTLKKPLKVVTEM